MISIGLSGHDTTAMALCWSLYLIGLDSEVQEKIHSEIDSVFGDDKSSPVSGEDLKRLKYLECCIKEALRLFPSVPALGRAVKEDFQLGPYTIPKGVTILISTFALHRDESIFQNPESYRPERFLTDNISKTSPYACVPFSAGPRNCIGQRFAMTEEKIILANIFRNFSIKSLDQRDQVQASAELVIRPKNPIRIKFELRSI
jgi:cytochrome P450 family 4